MELQFEAKRRLGRLIPELSDELALQLLEEVGLEKGISSKDRVDNILTNHDDDWSVSDYKTLWSAAELANFFTSWVQVFQVEPTEISLRKARQKIKHEELTNDNMIALELVEDPQLLFLARTPDTYRSLMDKTVTSEDVRDSIYWFPEMGILLTKMHEDEDGKLFLSIVHDQLVGEMEEFRIKSMIVSRMFDNERYINQLVVSAMSQITGFKGMDEIRFIGEDVKRGLGGLYRRQDIRVHLHEIGPNKEAENRNLHLRIGSELRVKNIDGIFELQRLIYPELYPSSDQIEELNERLKENGEITLNSLAQEWELDKVKIQFQLTKQIELNNLQASISDEKIVKK